MAINVLAITADHHGLISEAEEVALVADYLDNTKAGAVIDAVAEIVAR